MVIVTITVSTMQTVGVFIAYTGKSICLPFSHSHLKPNSNITAQVDLIICSDAFFVGNTVYLQRFPKCRQFCMTNLITSGTVSKRTPGYALFKYQCRAANNTMYLQVRDNNLSCAVLNKPCVHHCSISFLPHCSFLCHFLPSLIGNLHHYLFMSICCPLETRY